MANFNFETKGIRNKILKINILPFVSIENDSVAFSISFGWLFWSVTIWKYKESHKRGRKYSKNQVRQMKNLLLD